ncbi:hypothetical protein MJO28_011077 [Puccinia striiformis f. sp. tritici]|uniref:Nudix hydrolase domain-containing protein n=2 Tax=Puccinia striiformis f. sp. tritici TaxID=168172 RepID=A0A0L0V630_9BASI|nr:hypothetical protein Pst134EA_020785 [Puccinia striiformis f. sp. tritici]KAI9620266.1 hypothetical protein H4Q26_013835 [Puccinia striiformis f. sp. tritici PST-130]KNE94641.1 hypothetical protein PSTG_12004 [Puccinia striiformis f. sp. tritici PST-78]KAH9447559.1 hypothetical protein Pst134EB_021575 [Puccinia striiformis f. sp. tritici]KAH9456875.1 hypothetical protein Pst134EA_020785 [Puccinia striiformis f. sp. tritici]KAI7943549.1 hypothetical protein MJO28_011077 [Puccinia striiformis
MKEGQILIPRQVSVAIVYRLNSTTKSLEYLHISSCKHPHSWVLPKGGVEEYETSNHGLTASREAWEEREIQESIVTQLRESIDPKPHSQSTSEIGFISGAEYSFWLIKLVKEESWPEANQCQHCWVPRSEAVELVRWQNNGAGDGQWGW